MNREEVASPTGSDTCSTESSSDDTTVSTPLTLDCVSPLDDMTTVSSVNSDDLLNSPSSPVIYFNPKNPSEVVRLPHMTSGFVWNDGTVRDVEVQTLVPAQVHQGCQTDSVIHDFADRMVINLMVESFFSVVLSRSRRHGWESTEELTEPLSYDSGIEEWSRANSECTTLVKGASLGQEKQVLGTIGEDHLLEGIQSALDSIAENRSNGEVEEATKEIQEEMLVKEVKVTSEIAIDSTQVKLPKLRTDSNTVVITPLDDDSDVHSDSSHRCSDSPKSCPELGDLKKYRKRGDYIVTMANSSDSDVNSSDSTLPDIVDIRSKVKTVPSRKDRGAKGMIITDVSHIPGINGHESCHPLIDLDVARPDHPDICIVDGATIMKLDETAVSDFDVSVPERWLDGNTSKTESEADHLRRVEDEIIRSLQQRCAPVLIDQSAEVGKWLTTCSPQRNCQLSPVPEETEEESSCLSLEGSSLRDEVRTGTSQSSRESSILGEICSRTSATENSLDDADSVTSSVGDDEDRLRKEARLKRRDKNPYPFVEELKERLRARREQMNQEDCWETKKAEQMANSNEVWSPGTQPQQECQNEQPPSPEHGPSCQPRDVSGGPSGSSPSEDKENMSPVWQPFGGMVDDKPKFRSVKPGSPISSQKEPIPLPPPSRPLASSDNSSTLNTQEQNRSEGGPQSPGMSSRIGVSSGLPQYQTPTITLLQKAREGQLPKGAIYIDQNAKDDEIPPDAVLYDQRVTVDGDKVHTDSYYALSREEMSPTGHHRVIKAPPKIEGIGPTERGIPVSLRSGVKEEYASDWYKSMYKSLHKFDRPERRVPHTGGYMSEPEFERDDDYPYPSRYATMDMRRRPPPEKISYVDKPSTYRTSSFQPSHIYAEVYKNQPRSIAEYEPGRSSIAEREARRHTSKYLPPMDVPRLSYVDGYESDSTLIRKTGNRLRPLDPVQQKLWYREVQRGGDIPFSGLGKPAPERPRLTTVGPPPPPLPHYSEDELLANLRDEVSPHRYQEGEVNIHFRTPVRNLEKEFIEEETLRKRQEAAMRKFYEEERYKKQLQQVHEIEMRRHNDYFTPSQKSPIPLNRYDNPFDLPESPPPKTPEPRSMAKALFTFQAQSTRELSVKKGDIVYILKKVDRNWYEGEHHGMIGIFPVNYVEIIPVESAGLQPRKSTEGQARAKYNFRAQSPLELSLFKGELVILTRRVDQNWFEGRIGNKKGIFPASYVDVLSEPGDSGLLHSKKSPKLNGTRSIRTPNRLREAFSSYPATSQSTSRSDTTSMSSQDDKKQPITETLHVDTYSEPIPYKVLYSYRPQNDDELELREGDTVYVMEKCDDGWYVGTSLRTGLFGTFPGNYVERI